MSSNLTYKIKFTANMKTQTWRRRLLRLDKDLPGKKSASLLLGYSGLESNLLHEIGVCCTIVRKKLLMYKFMQCSDKKVVFAQPQIT